MLRASTGIAEFLADPVGARIVGNSYMFWCKSPQLFGFALWGRHGGDDAQQLIRLIEAQMQTWVQPPVDIVIDLRRVNATDMTAFQMFVEFGRKNVPSYSPRIRRQALVRPEGFMGAIATGFHRMLDPKHNWELFTSAPEAFAWLRSDYVDQGLCEEIDEVIAATLGLSQPLRVFREWLAHHLRDPKLAHGARAIGTSPRSLQRQLRQAGTSFRAEVESARIVAAKAMLIHSDNKLDAISTDLGWSSLSHFSGRFRRLVGMSPSEFRRRRQ